MFFRQFLDIADFHIRRNNAGPFGAGAQKPAAPPKQARRVERVPGNEQLHVLAAAEIRSDDDALRPASERSRNSSKGSPR